MRQEVNALISLGPLPDEDADEEKIASYDSLLNKISRPVSDEEACALVGIFGPDECYGLAWTLLHLIETAPNWPLEECLQNEQNEWVRRLRRGAENARLHKLKPI